MLNKISPFIMVCFILLISCSSMQKQHSYKNMLLEDDFAVDRLSYQFMKKAQKECPNITKDIKDLKVELSRPGASDNDHTKGELQWLQNWSKTLGCQDSREEASEIIPTNKPLQTLAPPAAETAPKAMPSLETITIDQCFLKCRELTSRTDAECFDACICR